ncbi:hypothetical protein AYI68_g3805 [Smittium mucronatum]|uniref:Uncharacterized protein n=1 Tax=Smittium mucronatum TaxID=133383 RepID=A0A1R0GYV4_9FUNG|nr:hypothetical protein AYI68_g3805 [Smittium mucronatum]
MHPNSSQIRHKNPIVNIDSRFIAGAGLSKSKTKSSKIVLSNSIPISSKSDVQFSSSKRETDPFSIVQTFLDNKISSKKLAETTKQTPKSKPTSPSNSCLKSNEIELRLSTPSFKDSLNINSNPDFSYATVSRPKSLVYVDVNYNPSIKSFEILDSKSKEDLVLCHTSINISTPVPQNTTINSKPNADSSFYNSINSDFDVEFSDFSLNSPIESDQSDIEDELLRTSSNFLKSFNLRGEKSETVSNGKKLTKAEPKDLTAYLLGNQTSALRPPSSRIKEAIIEGDSANKASSFLKDSASNRKTLSGILNRHKKRKKQLDIFDDLSEYIDRSSSSDHSDDQFSGDLSLSIDDNSQNNSVNSFNPEGYVNITSSMNLPFMNSDSDSRDNDKNGKSGRNLEKAMDVFVDHFKNKNQSNSNFGSVHGLSSFKKVEISNSKLRSIRDSAVNLLSKGFLYTSAYLGKPISQSSLKSLLHFILNSDHLEITDQAHLFESIKILKLHCSIVKDLPDDDIFSPSQLFNTLAQAGLRCRDFGLHRSENSESVLESDESKRSIKISSSQIVLVLELYAMSFQSFMRFKCLHQSRNQFIQFDLPSLKKSKNFKGDKKDSDSLVSIFEELTFPVLNALMTILNVLMDINITHQMCRVQCVLIAFVENIPEVFWSKLSNLFVSEILRCIKPLDIRLKLLLISERIPSSGRLSFVSAKIAYTYLSEQDSNDFIDFPDILQAPKYTNDVDTNVQLLVYLNKIKSFVFDSKYFKPSSLKPQDFEKNLSETGGKRDTDINNTTQKHGSTISPHFNLFFGVKMVSILLSPGMFMPFADFRKNSSLSNVPKKSPIVKNYSPTNSQDLSFSKDGQSFSSTLSFFRIMDPIHSKLLSQYRKLSGLKPNDPCLSDIKDSLNLVCVWLSMTWFHKNVTDPIYSPGQN